MKSMPIDNYWVEELLSTSGMVKYEGTNYKYYTQVEELYKMMPEQYKNSKEGC